MDIESIPKDEAHAKYRSAMIHMKAALANGKSVAEAHEIAKKFALVKLPVIASKNKSHKQKVRQR